MSRKQTTRHRTEEPDIAFLRKLEIDDEPPLRRLEVYEEARKLRQQVAWLAEQPTSPAAYVHAPQSHRRRPLGSDAGPGTRR